MLMTITDRKSNFVNVNDMIEGEWYQFNLCTTEIVTKINGTLFSVGKSGSLKKQTGSWATDRFTPLPSLKIEAEFAKMD